MIKKCFVLISILALTSCGNSNEKQISFYECIHKSLVWSEAFTLDVDKYIKQFPSSVDVYYQGKDLIMESIKLNGTIIYKEGLTSFHFHYDTKVEDEFGGFYYQNSNIVSATVNDEPITGYEDQMNAFLNGCNPLYSAWDPYTALREFTGAQFVITQTAPEQYVDYYYVSCEDNDRPQRYILSSETNAIIEEHLPNELNEVFYKATIPEKDLTISKLRKLYVLPGWNAPIKLDVDESVNVDVRFFDKETSLRREDTFSYKNVDYKWVMEVTEFGLVKEWSRGFPNTTELRCEY